MRRMYLALVALPPTLEEQHALLADTSADAFEELADEGASARLVDGERWGRHWLDLVRYAETNGYERDGTKPFAWRYRDYVIRSFNADKPLRPLPARAARGRRAPRCDRRDAGRARFTIAWARGTTSRPTRQDRFDQLDDIVNTTRRRSSA